MFEFECTFVAGIERGGIPAFNTVTFAEHQSSKFAVSIYQMITSQSPAVRICILHICVYTILYTQYLTHLQVVQTGGGVDTFSDCSKMMKLLPTELPAEPGLREVCISRHFSALYNLFSPLTEIQSASPEEIVQRAGMFGYGECVWLITRSSA